MAVQRILLGHALIAAWGGIPLIYMGDELALPNDYGYLDDPDHAHDSRWIHRPRMDWARAEARHPGDTPAARVFWGTKAILARRAATPALHAALPVRVVPGRRTGVLAFRALPRPARFWACSTSPNAGSRSAEGWARALGVTAMHATRCRTSGRDPRRRRSSCRPMRGSG